MHARRIGQRRDLVDETMKLARGFQGRSLFEAPRLRCCSDHVRGASGIDRDNRGRGGPIKPGRAPRSSPARVERRGKRYSGNADARRAAVRCRALPHPRVNLRQHRPVGTGEPEPEQVATVLGFRKILVRGT